MRASLVAAVLLTVGTNASAGECSPDHVDVYFGDGQARFTTEVADDPGEQARGLMFREGMPPFHSMLFVFPQPKTANFWMKNTPLPLDIIFASADGVIQTIAHDTTPYSEELIPGGPGIQFVLEVHAGTAQMLGIRVGHALQHPMIDSELAAIPCS